jgi:hypothetical protein
VITRSRLPGILVAAGWLLVSLLPWWQLRVAFDDESGSRARIFSADVWQASTPAALAVVVTAVASVVLVTTRGHTPQTPEQRGTGLFIACLPVVLLGWAAWSIGRLTAEPEVYRWVITCGDDLPSDDYHVAHDELEILTLPGYAEGPAWGLYVGVALVLAVTVWTTLRLRMPPKPS